MTKDEAYAADQLHIEHQLVLLAQTANLAQNSFWCGKKTDSTQYLRNLSVQADLLIEQISTMHQRAGKEATS